MKCYKQGFVASRLPFNQKTFSGQFLYQTNYHNFFANINSLPRFSAKTPAFCNDSWPLFVFVSRHWATCTDLFDLKNNFRNMFFAILGSWGFLLRKYGSRVFKVTSLFFFDPVQPMSFLNERGKHLFSAFFASVPLCETCIWSNCTPHLRNCFRLERM